MKRVLMGMMGLLALMMVVGCENGSDSDGDSSNPPNVDGTWKFTDLTFGKNATVVLIQSKQILTGTIDNFNGRHGVVDGTIDDDGAIKLRFTFPAGQTDFTGQASDSTMSGSWVDHRDGTTAQISAVKF